MRWLAASCVTLTIVLGALLGSASVAGADHLDVDVPEPETIEAGDMVNLQVVVRDAASGQRVNGATVTAYRETDFAGIAGHVELAQGVTDEFGIALLSWQERGPSSGDFTIEYSAVGDIEVESTVLSAVRVTDAGQIERSNSGVDIPGLGAWLLIALLVCVWGLIQYSVFGMVQVSQQGSQSGSEERSEEEEAEAGGETGEEGSIKAPQ